MVYVRNNKNIGIVLGAIIVVIGLIFGASSISEMKRSEEIESTSDALQEARSNEAVNVPKMDGTSIKSNEPIKNTIDVSKVDFKMLAKDLHGLVNLERQKQNLPELDWDVKLAEIAVTRSIDYHSKVSAYGDNIVNMDDPNFLSRSNNDYVYCGTDNAIKLSKELDVMIEELDDFYANLEIKERDYDRQVAEYELSGRNSQYDMLERNRIAYNLLVEEYEQKSEVYNDKLDQLNQMTEDGLYSEGPTEQITWYPLEAIDSSTYVELVHDMTTVPLPTQTWNEETRKFDLSYVDSSLFEYLYDKEDYNEMEKSMQNEGIGITLNNDIIFMSWYRC